MIRRAAAVLTLLAAMVFAHASAQQPPPTAQVSGRVVAADTGAPVRTASIRLLPVRVDVSTAVAQSDDDGRFELTGVAVGQYSLQISKPGFVSTSYGLTPDVPGPFGVSGGQKVSLGDVRLPRAGAIAGKVLDTFGDAVADITITAWRLEFLTPASRRVVGLRSFQSNDLGEFRIYGLQPGKYYVSAALRSAQLADAQTFYPGTPSLADAQPIEVRAGQEALGITLPLAPTPYGVVTGVVTDSRGAPYTSALAWLVSARTDGVMVNSAQLSAATDSEGRFRIVNVSPGEYRLEVFSKAWMDKVGATGSVGGAGQAGEMATVPVSVTGGGTVELAVRASAGFRVRGQVFVDGAPMPAVRDARVSAGSLTNAISASTIPSSAVVASDGTFVLEGLRGTRALGVAALAPWFVHHVLLGGTDVTERGFDVTGDLTGVEVHLTTRPARLEGTVKDASGAPVRDARLVVFSTNRGDWLLPGGLRYHALTATGEGTFRLASIPAGNYLAAVVPREDSGRWADPDYLENLRAIATPFTMIDGTTTTIVLTKKVLLGLSAAQFFL